MTATLATVDAIPVSICLLGPLRLTTDQGEVPLGGPRLRTLFGLLALRAPDVVSRSALIDGIWDASPPANAAKTLRAHIAYLRRSVIASRAGPLITTRPPGYALAVAPKSIDIYQFEHGVDEGRRAAATGAFAASVVHLNDALRLWRGEVLADCPIGEWARAETARLHEVRLHATEELYAAMLALGQHAQAATELDGLALRYPLRERLWELLMLALYRAGRQADALFAYRRARALLVEQLGVEPGPGLRRLEAAILAGYDSVAELTTGEGRARRIPATGGDPPPAHRLPPPSHLPVPLTSLIGRQAAIAELSARLTQRRLITLIGVGGSGKTRLAIAVATRIANDYVDGVHLIDLTPVADRTLLLTTLSSTLGVPADVDPVQAITAHLQPRQCLLVLDNCEHLVDVCATLVEALLRACPALTVLTTSRQTLGVPGELVWLVPPLASPCGQPSCLADIRQYDAVQLFLDRATPQAVRDLTDTDAVTLASLCAKLDGLPLAIELAAARTAVLTVAEIVDRLHDPSLLNSTNHPNRPHHRALDATIAWSYHLLDPASRSALRRLSVFVGGFTLTAAEAVLAGEHDPPIVNVLTDLATKSLILFERHPGGARYRILEIIRRWTSDRLAEHADEAQQAQTRHAAYYLQLAESIDRRLRGPDMSALLDQLTVEYGNVRAALAWYAGDPAELRLALALAQYCRIRGRYSEGRKRLDEALARCGNAPPAIAGRAMARAALFAFLLGRYRDAAEGARRALTVQLTNGDQADVAGTLRLLASVARERGDYWRAQAFLHQARCTSVADESAVASMLTSAGFTAWLAGELEPAEQLLRDALCRHRRLNDEENAAATRVHLAAVAFYRGDLFPARQLAVDALTWFTERDAKEGIGWALNILGLIALREGRPHDAITTLCASLAVHHSVGDQWRQASVLEALAAVFLSLAEPMRSAELIIIADSIRSAVGVPIPAVEWPAWRSTDKGIRRLLTAEERSAAAITATALHVKDVILALESVNRG